MRIIHDIRCPAQVCSGSEEWARRTDAVGKSTDFKVSLTIVCPQDLGLPTDAIHIEGCARHVAKALVDALVQIQVLAQMSVQDGKLEPDDYWTFWDDRANRTPAPVGDPEAAR